MSDYFGVSPEGYQKPLYLANNLSDVVDKAAARSNLGVASADDVLKAANPIGTIITFYGSVAPYGYLPCSGQTISSTTFPSLVTFLGGTTSATLPDLRGEFLRGWDNGRGVDVARSIGTWQKGTVVTHDSDGSSSLTPVVVGSPVSSAASTNEAIGADPYVSQASNYNLQFAFSSNAGSVGAANTYAGVSRPRNVSVLYCIKAYDTPVSATTLNLTSLINEFQLGRSVSDFVNLRSSATGLSALVSTTADELTLKTAATQYRTFTNVSVSINPSSVGLNGLDTGTLAISTWYSTWVISDGTNVAGLISTSVLNPTLPAGYTYKIRTGWVRTDSNATNKFPLSFIQFGRKIQYDPKSGTNLVNTIQIASATSSIGTPVSISIANVVPSTAISIDVLISASAVGASVAAGVYPRVNSGVSGIGAIVPSGGTSTNKGTLLLAEPNIYWNVAVTSSGNLSLSCAGFEDSI